MYSPFSAGSKSRQQRSAFAQDAFWEFQTMGLRNLVLNVHTKQTIFTDLINAMFFRTG